MRSLVWVLACLGAVPSLDRCRCAERTLSEYFEGADEVFAGTLVGTEDFDEDRRLFRFEVEGEPYKGDGEGAPIRPFVSAASSAGCGVEVDSGAVYLVFATHDPEGGVARIDTCSGTRVHRASDGALQGFRDVPPRFVASRLEALAGLEALRRVASATPDPEDPESEALVGLLDVAAFSHAPEVPLFEAPDRGAARVGPVSGYADLETRESGYEVDAAEVYAVLDGWYKVRRKGGGFAWLPPEAGGTWWPLAELLPGRLAYLTLEWNRWVWPGPGAGNPTRVSYPTDGRPREQPVNILGATEVGGTTWLQVEVLASNPCEGEPETVRIGGWVPAHGESGDPVAWYYSRGC